MSSYWQHMVAGAFDRGPNKPPPDRAVLAAAALELAARGLTARDIATALRLLSDPNEEIHHGN